jgi:hypothetical protein
VTPPTAGITGSPSARRAALPIAAALLATVLAPDAFAARWTWSGSLALDYKKILDAPDEDPLAKTGAVVQASLKATVDVTEQVSASIRLCTACHGLTLNQAYAELRLAPVLNVDVGRIDVPFGDYSQRHDPANDAFLSTPLPYAMGHMLRYQSDRFNLGVLPQPYVDQGAVLFGDVWIRDTIQIWYAGFGVNGFQSSVARDFTFKNQLGDGGFSDNSDDVSWGGRVVLARGGLTAGASYLRGAYDPDAAYDYDAWGLDASAWIRGAQIRGEYLVRGTEAADGDWSGVMRKKGFYLQAESPAVRRITLVGRFDGLLRQGAPLGTSNDASSGIVRWTGGVNVAPTPDTSVRLHLERWRFTDFVETDVLRLGVVVAY